MNGGCRVCGSLDTVRLGVLHAYSDYSTTVYDCRACGCRFAPHEPLIYERLHAADSSSYRTLDRLELIAADAWETGKPTNLRSALRAISKFRFVIDAVEHRGSRQRILEIGCGTGYLAAYFMLTGHTVLGADISRTAVAKARSSMGDHFVLADDDRVRDTAPYDVVLHVGTVGCVPDPIRFTLEMLALVDESGVLVFNAPNAQVVRARGGLWNASTTPPDLVTLFTPDFWAHQFSERADVAVEITDVEPGRQLIELLRPSTDRRGHTSLLDARVTSTAGATARPWRLLRSFFSVAGRVARRLRLLPRRPAEFGVHVTIRPRP